MENEERPNSESFSQEENNQKFNKHHHDHQRDPYPVNPSAETIISTIATIVLWVGFIGGGITILMGFSSGSFYGFMISLLTGVGIALVGAVQWAIIRRSEETTSALQSHSDISVSVFCL